MTSTPVATALAFVHTFDTFGTLDTSKLLSFRCHQCIHISSRLHHFHYPLPLDNAAYAEFISNMVPFIERWPVTAKEIIGDEKLNRVTIWAESEAKFKDEVKDDGIDEGEWVWKGEYVFIFSMDKSGEKIERIVEFLDSKTTEKGMLLVERAKANVERRKKSKSYVDWAVQSTRRSLDPLKGLSLDAKSFFNLIMASKKINALVWKTVKLRVKRSRKISTEAFSILKSLRNLASKSPESQSY
jgi:hypothetical protein